MSNLSSIFFDFKKELNKSLTKYFMMVMIIIRISIKLHDKLNVHPDKRLPGGSLVGARDGDGAAIDHQMSDTFHK